MQNRQSFGCLRFAFVYIWKKKNFHHLRLYLEKNTDHADAAFGCSNASLSLTNVRELLPQPLWRCFLI